MLLETVDLRASSRRVLLVEATSPAELLDDIASLETAFVLLLVFDATDILGSELVRFASGAIRGGATYVCVWGPDCARVHNAFDEADLEVNGESTDDRVLMTTDHADEPLEEAVWFALNAAYPAGAYESTTQATVLATIGSPAWATTVRDYVRNGAPLRPEP
jgi:hypothetical protein